MGISLLFLRIYARTYMDQLASLKKNVSSPTLNKGSQANKYIATLKLPNEHSSMHVDT